MKRTARVWISGGREHDDDFQFKDLLDFFKQLKELQARWQVGIYKLHLHGDLQKLECFMLPKGDIDVDMVPLDAQGAPLQQRQHQSGLYWEEAQQMQGGYEQLRRRRIEDQDKREEELADAHAKEQEHLSSSELDFTHYKADVGEYFNSIGMVASQYLRGSRHGYRNIHEHCD